MTDEQKEKMLLEERYADVRIRIRNAYVEYKYAGSKKNDSQFREYLQSLKSELEELENKLGNRADLLYGRDSEWWVS